MQQVMLEVRGGDGLQETFSKAGHAGAVWVSAMCTCTWVHVCRDVNTWGYCWTLCAVWL